MFRSVCLSVCKQWLVRTLSPKPLLGISPNLVCMCILPSFQHPLIMGDLDLHLQGHLAVENLEFCQFGLVRAISQKVLHGISPNLHRICILLSFQHLLNMVTLTYIFKVIWVKKTLEIGSFWAYLHDQSWSHFSPMAFRLGANRVHLGKFNISSGFFEILKLKKK